MIKEFYWPQTVEEAAALKKRHPGGVYFAGGTVVNHGMNGDAEAAEGAKELKEAKGSKEAIEAEEAISLDALGLASVTEDGGDIYIGAMVRLQDLIDDGSRLVPEILKAAAKNIYSRNIRHMATVGGNIAACWKAAALVPALAASGAELVLGDGSRRNVEDFIRSRESGRSGEELITAVCVPLSGVLSGVDEGSAQTGRRKTVLRRVTRNNSYATVVQTAFSCQLDEDGSISKPYLALNGLLTDSVLVRDAQLEALTADYTKKDAEILRRKLQEILAGHPEFQGNAQFSGSYIQYITAQLILDSCAEALSSGEVQ